MTAGYHRGMGKLYAIATLALVACQPMYGAPAPRVKNPTPIRHTELVDPPAPPKIYVEECNLRTTPVLKPAKRDIARSEEHVKKADATLTTADRTAVAQAKGDLLIDGIEEYGNALERDPYNAEATLKLARAYDKVQRKGCALRLLGRLAKLADHPNYQRQASEQIEDVENHKAWFEDYRKDALRTLGR